MISAIILFASVATGEPIVGETAVFRHTVTPPKGESRTSESTIKVVGTRTGEVLVQYTDTAAPDIVPAPVWGKLGKFENDVYVTASTAREIVKNCVKEGGKIEQVVVPAGEYRSCRRTYETDLYKDGIRWYADVPNGVVKDEMTFAKSGKRNVFELIRVSAGQIPKR